MGYISSVISFDHTDELLPIYSIPCQQHTTKQDELLLTSLDGSGHENKPDHSRRRKSWVTFGKNDENPHDYKKKKKIIHRDIERQRRQEMATLYGSLRSLIPHEYPKGKRSISDHLHEAVNYIRHLQKKIQDLSDKRDVLKSLSNSNTVNIKPECSQNGSMDSVTVKPCWAGVEVVINTALREEGLPLSRALGALIGEGLSVVSCTSTKVNERQLYTIESEVSDEKNINLSGLQQKLADLII